MQDAIKATTARRVGAGEIGDRSGYTCRLHKRRWLLRKRGHTVGIYPSLGALIQGATDHERGAA